MFEIRRISGKPKNDFLHNILPHSQGEYDGQGLVQWAPFFLSLEKVVNLADPGFFVTRANHHYRLWAEVFHVSASGAGTVKWQQVSEDFVGARTTYASV